MSMIDALRMVDPRDPDPRPCGRMAALGRRVAAMPGFDQLSGYNRVRRQTCEAARATGG